MAAAQLEGRGYYGNSERFTRALRPMTEPALRRHVQTAVKKAVEMGLAAEVRRLDHGHYLVPSTSRGGVTHVVTGTGADLDCTCEAGEHLPYCVHRAAVALRRLHEQGYAVEVDAAGVMQAIKRTRVEDLVFPPARYGALLEDAPPIREVPR